MTTMLSLFTRKLLSPGSGMVNASLCSRRKLSSVTATVVIENDPMDERLIVMKMNRPPVNALNLEFLEDILRGLDRVEKEADHGLILGSAIKGIFCAGLDMTEMHNPHENRLRDFWFALQEFWIRFYSLRLPVAAAVAGHAPAAGTAIVASCDYRVMVDNDLSVKIGLNEASFGLVAPPWFAEALEACMGRRTAERTLQKGTLFTAREAYEAGLVDATATDLQDALNLCRKELSDYLKSSLPAARHSSKMIYRQAAVDRLANNRQQDFDHFRTMILQDDAQKSLGAYIASLRKKV